LCFALVAFACVSCKKQQTNAEIELKNPELELKAEAVPEGICLIFDNIPTETGMLFIGFQNWGENDHADSTLEIISSYAHIMGIELRQVKQTGRIIFPFVKAGQNYRISVKFGNAQGQAIDGVPDYIYAECVANAGIYFNDGVKLELNKTNTGATLSYELEFSADVQYALDKYSYTVTIIVSDNVSIVHSGRGTALHWNFEPGMTNEFKQAGYLQNDNYSAYVTAYRNINYDDVTWTVEIAKTPEFIYSLN
jgi:hypothetical protein